MSARVEWIAEPGFYPALDADRYFDDPCPEPSLTQSIIKVLNAKSPRHAAFDHPRLNPYGRRDDPSKAQFLGSAVHRLALGRGREVSVIRYRDYRSGAARDARDLAVANKRIPILESVYSDALRMADVLREKIDEALEGAPYETEVPFVWQRPTRFGPIWARGMLDVWSRAIATGLDVKTTAGDATPEAVGRDIAANQYDVQDSWYRDGIGRVIPELAGRVRFEFLYVETAAPNGSRPFVVDEASRFIAQKQCDRAADLFARCLRDRDWPSYPRRPALVGTPPWYQNAWLARELEES